MYVIDSSGKKHKAVPATCLTCQEPFKAMLNRGVRAKKAPRALYCSLGCFRAKGRVFTTCAWCGIEVARKASLVEKNKSGTFFCSREHRDWAKRLENDMPEARPSHYGVKTQSTYRSNALRAYGSKCEGCGYAELQRMLDVHHIDHNHNNHDIENLIVLCVWCHALVTRGFAEITDDRQIQRNLGAIA